MKKSFVLSLALAVAATASYAAPKPCSAVVRSSLERSLQNEREAAARYKAFAEKAAADGFENAARLFRAAVRAENVHAKRFEQAMKERGIEIPPVPEFTITPGETASNLRTAASNETGERDGAYHDAVKACERDGDKEIGAIFDQTRDVEAEHANLFNATARTLSSKEHKSYYVCDHCGYTSDLDLPLCVLCRQKGHPDEVN